MRRLLIWFLLGYSILDFCNPYRSGGFSLHPWTFFSTLSSSGAFSNWNFHVKSFQNLHFSVKMTDFHYDTKVKALFACEHIYEAPGRLWCLLNPRDKPEAPQLSRKSLKGAWRLLKVKIFISDAPENGQKWWNLLKIQYFSTSPASFWYVRQYIHKIASSCP